MKLIVKVEGSHAFDPHCAVRFRGVEFKAVTGKVSRDSAKCSKLKGDKVAKDQSQRGFRLEAKLKARQQMFEKFGDKHSSTAKDYCMGKLSEPEEEL